MFSLLLCRRGFSEVLILPFPLSYFSFVFNISVKCLIRCTTCKWPFKNLSWRVLPFIRNSKPSECIVLTYSVLILLLHFIFLFIMFPNFVSFYFPSIFRHLYSSLPSNSLKLYLVLLFYHNLL